jgi:hypothetical protein
MNLLLQPYIFNIANLVPIGSLTLLGGEKGDPLIGFHEPEADAGVSLGATGSEADTSKEAPLK